MRNPLSANPEKYRTVAEKRRAQLEHDSTKHNVPTLELARLNYLLFECLSNRGTYEVGALHVICWGRNSTPYGLDNEGDKVKGAENDDIYSRDIELENEKRRRDNTNGLHHFLGRRL